MDKEVKKLNALAEEARFKMLDARNKLMLEAVVSAFLDVNSPEETAAILREVADQLEDYR